MFQQFHLAAGRPALDNVADGLLYAGVPLRGAAARARRPRWTGSGWATGSTTGRTSCPAASGSGWRSPGRWSASRRCCSPTSRPATSTRPPAPGVMALLRELHAAGTTVVVITHDREIAASLPRQVRMRDGRGGRTIGLHRSGERGGARSRRPGCAGDVLRVGAAGLRTRPLRAFLSALGIAIGIAAMIAVVGISSSSPGRPRPAARRARHQPAHRRARATTLFGDDAHAARRVGRR